MVGSQTPDAPQPASLCPIFGKCPCNISSMTRANPPDLRQSRTDIGIGEKVDLRVGVAGKDATWRVEGAGRLERSDAISAVLVAGAQEGKVKVTATIGSSSCSLEFNVIAPKITLRAVGPLWHVEGRPTCGFTGIVYLAPATVSFEFVSVRELDDQPTVATGYYTPYAKAWHRGVDHDAGATGSIGVSPPAIGHPGSLVNRSDDIRSGDPHANDNAPVSEGELTFPARLEYSIDGTTWYPFPPGKQTFKIDAAGTCTGQKFDGNPVSFTLDAKGAP